MQEQYYMINEIAWISIMEPDQTATILFSLMDPFLANDFFHLSIFPVKRIDGYGVRGGQWSHKTYLRLQKNGKKAMCLYLQASVN